MTQPLFRGFPCFPKVISTGSFGLRVTFSGMFVNDNHHLVYRDQWFGNITVYPFQQFHDFAMHIQCIRKVLLPINKADGFIVVDSVPEFSDLYDSCIDVWTVNGSWLVFPQKYVYLCTVMLGNSSVSWHETKFRIYPFLFRSGFFLFMQS